MKATIKLMNPNACGANSIESYDSIKYLKNYLNHCLYYSNEVYLNIEGQGDFLEYSKTGDVRSLLSDAKFYNSVLCVIPTF